ncbi:MAG TPA: hypothetical protein VIV57_20810 [Anaeromyxobacter sp.]
MASVDVDRVLEMLRDPNVESAEIATAAGVSREEAGRAARLVHGIARAKAEELATLPGVLAVAAARAALAASRTDALAALAAHPEKEVAKEAKRGLHLLKIRGVAVPEVPAPAPPPAAAAPAEPPLAAYASAIDGRGEQAVWLPRILPGKGIEVGQVVISDSAGLLELQVAVLGRKEWRQLGKALVAQGAAMGVGEIDRGRAHALAAAARARNDRSGQRVPDGADRWLSQLGAAPPLPDPAASFPPLPEDEERDAVSASAKLHDLPLLKSWMADEEFLRGIAAKLDEILVSPLYLDERQRQEQLARVVSQAAETYLDEERRALLSSRLFAVAAHLADRGDDAHARLAAATARAIASGAAATSVPFARLLVAKAFPPAGPSAPGPAASPPDSESPLIVAPR